MTGALVSPWLVCVALAGCVPTTPFFFDSGPMLTGVSGPMCDTNADCDAGAVCGANGCSQGTYDPASFRVDSVTGNGDVRPSGGNYIGDGIVVSGAGLDAVPVDGVTLAAQTGHNFTSFTIRTATSTSLELVLGADVILATPVSGSLRVRHPLYGTLSIDATIQYGRAGAAGAPGPTGNSGARGPPGATGVAATPGAAGQPGGQGGTGLVGPPPTYVGQNGISVGVGQFLLAVPVVATPTSFAFSPPIVDAGTYAAARGVGLPIYRVQSAASTLGQSSVACLGSDKVVSGGCTSWYDVIPATGVRQTHCYASRSYPLDDHTWLCFPSNDSAVTVNYTTTGCYTVTTALCMKTP